MIDYYSEYNQISLDKWSYDLTTFLIDIDLLRNTRLSQEWINSIAYFQYIIIKVYYKQISPKWKPSFYEVFLYERDNMLIYSLRLPLEIMTPLLNIAHRELLYSFLLIENHLIHSILKMYIGTLGPLY